MWIEIIGAIALFIIELVAAVLLARSKNRRPLVWFVLTLVASVPALLVLFMLPPAEAESKRR